MWIISSLTTQLASIQINILETGYACSKTVTILNIIEQIGALEWYNAKLEQAKKAPPPIKRGAPRKRLATVVLDKYLKEAYITTAIKGPKNPILKDNKDRPLSLDLARI